MEWRVVNSAEYGFPQRRKRVYVFAERNAGWTTEARLQDGVMSRAFPMEAPGEENIREVFVPEDPYDASENFNLTGKTSPFMDAGVMVGHRVLTCPVIEKYDGARKTLGDVLIPLDEVPEEFFIEPEQLPKW